MTDTTLDEENPAESGAEATPSQFRTELSRVVAAQASRLQQAYLRDESWAVAALAKLRRGVGREPGEIIELLAWTSPDVYVDKFRDGPTTVEERASHDAITLFAMHQQSHRDKGMHRPRVTFGDAARRLRIDLGEHGEAGVLRRFNAVGTATDHRELVRHARGLIQQFRTASIPLDYGVFADDLRKLANPETRSEVRNRWGRHFHRTGKSTGATPESAPAAEDQ